MVQEQPEGVVTIFDVAAQDIVRGHFDLLSEQVESHGGRGNLD